jgi:TolA-binding protein
MSRNFVNRSIVASFSLVIVSGLCLALAARAADEKQPSADGAKAKKDRAEARGPLPPYYRDVIDGIQKEKMYKIHESYEGKIDDLRKQIRALEDKCDAEMTELLRPDQKERIKQLTDEAKSKRKKTADKNAATSSQAASSASASTKP